MLRRIERRIPPGRRELRRADVPGDRAVRQVHRRAVVRAPVALRIHGAAVGTRNVEDLLLRGAVLDPPLDDLRALQRRAARIAGRPDEESRSTLRAAGEVAAHRNTPGIAAFHQIRSIRRHVVQAVAGEEAHADAGPARAEGLLAAERVVDGLARVLLRPHAGEAGGAEESVVRLREAFRVGAAPDLCHALVRLARQRRRRGLRTSAHVKRAVLGSRRKRDRRALLRRRVPGCQLRVVIRLVPRIRRVVRIARAHEAEAERVEALLLLQADAADQRLAGIAAGDVAQDLRRDTERQDLEARPLVVGRQQRVRLRGALDLRHFDQGLVAHARFRIGRIERRVGEVRGLEHLAVGTVAVVRDRERLVTVCARPVHPRPEILRVHRIEHREGDVRGNPATENHVAVQVLQPRHGGVFVADEGRETPRLVVPVRRRHDVCPGGTPHLAVDEPGGLLRVPDHGHQCLANGGAPLRSVHA